MHRVAPGARAECPGEGARGETQRRAAASLRSSTAVPTRLKLCSLQAVARPTHAARARALHGLRPTSEKRHQSEFLSLRTSAICPTLSAECPATDSAGFSGLDHPKHMVPLQTWGERHSRCASAALHGLHPPAGLSVGRQRPRPARLPAGCTRVRPSADSKPSSVRTTGVQMRLTIATDGIYLEHR